jgi:hypothetical protein
MDNAALERALAATETRPLLVDARLVRRVIKRHRHLPGFGLQVPHARCYWIGRAALLDIVSAAELGRAAADLPDEVILLPRPDADERARPDEELLTHLWRYAFHARVHLEIERRRLSEAMLRERIHRIGQTEFDEIRLVLRQDDLLLPPREDPEAYAELGALYLELRHFAPARIGDTFPILGDHRAIDAVLAQDVDAERLLAACRPAGAPETPRLAAPPPEPAAEEAAEEPGAEEPPPGTLRGEAEEARRRGNVVRSALSRMRLAAAGGPEAGAAEAEARADLAALARRLDAALRAPGGEGGPGIDVKAWEAILFALCRRAAHRLVFRWVEARLLYDLQRAAHASEKAIGKVDLVDWAISLGRRPLARLLPATRPIRVARELASAMGKVSRVGLPERERARLGELLAAAHHRADDNIRAALRPVVRDALHEVGLRPQGVPEQVAAHKVVEELLDHATVRGYLGLGQLRDALSRNQLKLGDLAGGGELWRGDALLLADRQLSQALDGVHRRGEIYLRFLQKLSSLLFGTRPGRFVALYFLLPFAAAFVLLEGVGHIIGPLGHLLHLLPPHHHLHLLTPLSFPLTAAVIFGMIHSAGVRAAGALLARGLGMALAGVFFHAPRWVLTRAPVQLLLRSRPVFLLRRYVLKPAVITAVLYPRLLHGRPTEHQLAVAAAVFLGLNLILNSRTGALVEEIALDAMARSLRRLWRRVLPGLFRLIAETFRRITDAIDRGIYAVDEWLRFREGQSRVALVGKAVLGLGWFAIAYLLRIYTNLLIEPQINPIKHFPVVTVAAKIMLPLSPKLIPAFHEVLWHAFGRFVANTLAAPTILLLPGIAGFLVWEFKENYKLYRATRPRALQPVSIGHHGESMGALLKPGLHSGTVPKLWAKLRRATRKGLGSAEKHHEAMRELQEALERFVEREMLALLVASPAWKSGPVRVARVELASNRVRVVLARGAEAQQPQGHGEAAGAADADGVAIDFEEQSGWLVASVARAGWLAELGAVERVLFENALGGLYQLAGVELVREQLQATLGGLRWGRTEPSAGAAAPPYDVSSEGLVVWPAGFATELVYALEGRAEPAARVHGEPPETPPPALSRKRILFHEQPILWAEWVEAWGSADPRRVVKGDSLLPALG